MTTRAAVPTRTQTNSRFTPTPRAVVAGNVAYLINRSVAAASPAAQVTERAKEGRGYVCRLSSRCKKFNGHS